MNDSLVMVHGWAAMPTVVLGLWLISLNLWRFTLPAQLRMMSLWVLWCVFTPMRPWYIDVPLMAALWLVAEYAYWVLSGRKRRSEAEP